MSLKEALRADKNLTQVLGRLADDADALRRELASENYCRHHQVREIMDRIDYLGQLARDAAALRREIGSDRPRPENYVDELVERIVDASRGDCGHAETSVIDAASRP